MHVHCVNVKADWDSPYIGQAIREHWDFYQCELVYPSTEYKGRYGCGTKNSRVSAWMVRE